MCGVPNVYLDAMLADDLAEMLDLVCEQCAISDVFACREWSLSKSAGPLRGLSHAAQHWCRRCGCRQGRQHSKGLRLSEGTDCTILLNAATVFLKCKWNDSTFKMIE
jgi:hypothetical protein